MRCATDNLLWSYRPSTGIFMSRRVPPRQYSDLGFVLNVAGLATRPIPPSHWRGRETLQGAGVRFSRFRTYQQYTILLLRKATEIKPSDPTLKHWDCFQYLQFQCYNDCTRKSREKLDPHHSFCHLIHIIKFMSCPHPSVELPNQLVHIL